MSLIGGLILPWEYLALGEEICATFPFKSYFTLKYECWPKNVDEDSFKGTWKKLMRGEQVEEHASSHEEDVCIEEDQTTTYDTSSELTDEADDTSVLDGYTSDESTKDEDATSYDDYEEMFQSADVEDPTSFTEYDAYNEGSSSVIAPTHDEDSTPYFMYDVDDDEDVTVPRHDDEIEQIPLALQDLENRLLVTEEQIVQVLTREDGAHKFIEDLMWRTQLEERQRGVADGVTSTQLCIIKEAQEQMKLITCSCSWIGTLLLSSLKTRKGRLRSFVTS
jgi:hypothetical protein